ncbi:hypothetical protein LSCM1_07215 [Leishmania martiniquensis]|uniref:non-specific serine/threonine protein kinase n=1 Tax=Leishmania martiniquensis TaxID=1580590 RepID=A0A836GPK1_9TRYP|nr:hypothetical protein LSCM1_07215 [Leishmania martiniquensis]
MNPVDELNLLLGIGPSRPQLPITLRKSGYVPVRSLGKGSYGQALLVFHEPQQQYFVVKHLNLASMSSRQRHDAHNEINILQKLHHPNIVRYVEYYEEHLHLYIVMEYADGGDVYSLLSSAQAARKLGGAGWHRGGAPASPRLQGAPPPSSAATEGLLSEQQIVSLFVQTTMAVKYMHDRRLLHRDIKSSNIFLTKNHVVKLGDFGISTVLQSTVAMASTMCGTPCYFSPELCQGRPYNSKSDMWALGVLLYELCAGHVPFESTTMKALMRDIVHKQPPRIPAVYSEELWELIVQLLQKDARRRPDAGQVLMSPVLMKHVPDLIDQLADNTAVGDTPAARDAVGACRGEASCACAAAAAPPSLPPRRVPQASPSPPKAGDRGAASPVPSATAAAAALPASSSPASPSAARAPEKEEPPSSPPQAQRQPAPHVGSGGGAGDASIEELIARFDMQKQHIAEAKRGESERHAASQGTASRGGAPHVPGAAGSPRLSPGAAAALQQQGLLAKGTGGGGREAPAQPSVAGASQGAAGAARSRAAFMPPPLPEALRSAAVVDQCGARSPSITSSPSSRPRNGAAAAPMPSVVNGDAAQETRSGGAGESGGRAQPSPAPPQRPHVRGTPNERAAPPLAARIAAPTAGELNAMLSELSSWRERSVRRQQRQGGHGVDRDGASGRRRAAKADASTPSSLPSATPCQPGNLSEHVGSPKPVAMEGAASREPKGGETASHGKQPHGGGGGPQAAKVPAADATGPIGRAPAASLGANVRSSDDDVDGDRSATQSFVDELGTALDVDAVQAASAAAHQQQQQRPSPPLTSAEGAVDVSKLSGRAPLSQQSMKRTFLGTRDRLDALQPTLVAGTLFRHTSAGVMLAGAMRGTDAATAVTAAALDGGMAETEGASGVPFTTACLCGRATTSNGCLSMIYGSFVCSCDVCGRFTGAARGVEWLHLPEVAHGLLALLSPPTPSKAPGGPSTTAKPSAGAGAAAAVVLRAQTGGALLGCDRRQAEEERGAGGDRANGASPLPARSPGVFSPSSSTTSGVHLTDRATVALGRANIRAYSHCSQVEAPRSLGAEEVQHQPAPHAPGGRLTGGDGSAAATRQAAVYIIYTCLTCGALVAMQHEGVAGLLLPKSSLDAQALDILSSCAQAVELDAADSIKAG